MGNFSGHPDDEAAPSARALGIFEQLRASATAVQLVQLRASVANHLAEIRKAAVTNELLPVDVAEQLTAYLLQLLDTLHELPEEHRSTVIGAALYFVSNNDEVPDTSGVLGLDDDAAVFNHVARLIGRPDLLIDF